jgi:hypothetical protein
MQSTKLLDDEPGLVSARDMQIDDELSAPQHDEIARLAYSYWEARGCQGGSHLDDWFRAEQELKKEK